jgi:hypothetical protein
MYMKQLASLALSFRSYTRAFLFVVTHTEHNLEARQKLQHESSGWHSRASACTKGPKYNLYNFDIETGWP